LKRILVTGGAGFISSNMIRHLLDETGHEVVTMDALTYAGNLENLSDVMNHERLRFIRGDIRDVQDVAAALEGVDVIVNAAAESHVSKSIEQGGAEFVTTNVVGTQVLLDAIREQPVDRFILISSSEVYGTAVSDPMTEDHPLNPRSPYAGTKAGGDRLAYSYWCTYDLPVTVIRPFNNYGPYQHPEKVIPRFIIQALTDQPLTIHGGGGATRDWLHVRDTADAITRACEVPLEHIKGETINVATGVDESVEQIADMILDMLGKPASLKAHVDDRPGQVDRHVGSTDKAERLLQWTSSIAFVDGLEQTIVWYRENPEWWQKVLATEQTPQTV
jgi:dTDP-glucose 4,6-dehydratase